MGKRKTESVDRPPIPKSVWALGFVSMFMDISSEMIHALLPVFLVSVLHANMAFVGAVEGIGEATASITKMFSGWLSDRFGSRKFLAILGYGLGTLSKPLFAFAPTANYVLGARFTDRVGKGIRGAPRDALVSDITPPEIRGAAFGLRQSLDTVGAFVGPMIALVIMALVPNGFRLVFSVAIVPGVIAVIILATFVKEPKFHSESKKTNIKWSEWTQLGTPFWSVTAIGTIMTFARFSEAFLVLRAQNTGLPIALTPLVLITMNIVYGASAYPIGILSDRLTRSHLLVVGFGLLFLADFVLASSSNTLLTGLGIAIWGLHMGATQGVLSAMIADTSPANLKGTAFGMFNLLNGIAVLGASFIAGLLWQKFGPAATFEWGCTLSLFGLIGSVPFIRRSKTVTTA